MACSLHSSAILVRLQLPLCHSGYLLNTMFLSLCFLDPSLFHQPAIGGAGVQVQIVGAPTTFHHHGNTFFPHYCDTLTLGAHYSVRTMMATILFTHTTRMVDSETEKMVSTNKAMNNELQPSHPTWSSHWLNWAILPT